MISPTLDLEKQSPLASMARVGIIASAVGALAYLSLGPTFDTGLQGRPFFRTLLTFAVGLLAFGMSYGTRWQRCTAILGVAAVGQCGLLGLIDAPNFAVLQHYFSWQELSGRRLVFLILLGVQSLIALPAVWRRRHTIRQFLNTLMPLRWVLLILPAIAFLGVNTSRDLGHYALSLGLSSWMVALNLVFLALAAEAAPAIDIRRFSDWVSHDFEGSAWDKYLPLACATLTVLVSATLCWTVFGRVPHVPDEVSYLFQAKYFSTGQLYLPAPPDALSFKVGQVFTDGQKWFGYGFPGWPATLALGVRAGVPWLVNPTLAGIAVLLTHALLTLLYSRRLAHLTVLLLIASPWFLYMSATFMTHTLSFALVLGGLVALEKQRRSSHILWALIAGICLGAVVLTRPLEGVVLGTVMGLWALGFAGKRLRFAALCVFAISSVLLGSLILPYNRLLTGSPTRTPQQVWTDAEFYPGSDRLGFGPEIGNWGWAHLDPFPGHGLRDVLVNDHQNLYSSNFELFGWSFGSLTFIMIAIVFGRKERSDRLFLTIAAGVIFAQSFYWFSGGPDYGARYWYQLLIPMVLLTLRGIEELQNRSISNGGTWQAGRRIGVFVAFASMLALITILPWRGVGKFHNFRRVRPDMRELAREHPFGDSIVFIRGGDSDYASAFVFNPPSLDSAGTIYVHETTPEARERVRQRFPHRPSWFVSRSGKDRAFAIVGGPLPAADMNQPLH